MKLIHFHEVLMVSGFVGVAILGGAVMSQGCYDERPTAERQAQRYLRSMHPDAHAIHVTCMNQDTDNNGYVSCDAIVDDRNVALECAANAGCWFACNDGCKLRQVVQIQQVQTQ
jgi:hypothetical protein